MMFEDVRKGLALSDAGYDIKFNAGEIERLFTSHEKLLVALKLTEFGFNHARCPVCAGWDGTTERDKVHSKTCPVADALKIEHG